MNAPQQSPGWYTDPADPAFLRYWSGDAWSAHRKVRPGLPVPVQERKRRTFFGAYRHVA